MLARAAPIVLVLLMMSATAVHAQHMNLATSPCKKDVTTIGLEQCFDRARLAADHQLNEVYAQIRHVLSPQEQDRLVQVERLWIQYRDASCAAERDLYQGGTASEPVHLACLEAETRRRIEDLKAGYEWRVGK